MKEQRWAYADEINPDDKILHISNTIPTARGRQWWLYEARPKGMTIDEWDKETQAKWDRIFGKKEG